MDTLKEWMSFLGYTEQVDLYKKSLLNEADPSYVQSIYGLIVKGLEIEIPPSVPFLNKIHRRPPCH